MPSPFNVKGEVILLNALTFKVKPEVVSENPFIIYVNLALRKYQFNNIVFNQASENQHGMGRRSREKQVGGAVRAGEGSMQPYGIVWNPLDVLSSCGS